jgi:hypothetical protein
MSLSEKHSSKKPQLKGKAEPLSRTINKKTLEAFQKGAYSVNLGQNHAAMWRMVNVKVKGHVKKALVEEGNTTYGAIIVTVKIALV